MANTTWNSSDKAANITLSGGNLTAAATSATVGSVRSIDNMKTGKFYWEVTYNVAIGSNVGAGISTGYSALTATAYNAVDATAGVAFNTGSLYVRGSLVGISFGAVTVGSVVCLAFDATNSLLWIRIGAAGNWNANASNDPATGVGGVAVPGFGKAFAVYANCCFAANAGQQIANFGATAFAGAVPSGYTSGIPSGSPGSVSNEVVTQAAVEQWASIIPPQLQLTQAAIEQWVTTNVTNPYMTLTQAGIEQWVTTRPPIELAGNLGGSSSYGKLSYGLKKYSWASAFAPVFAGDVSLVPVVNFSGDLAPIIVLAADLDIHINLIALSGDFAPQVAIGGSLSLDLPLTVLEGGLTPNVALGASSFVSGPLWAAEAPVAPPWAESEPCPPPPWMTTAPCDPVVWTKTRQCNG